VVITALLLVFGQLAAAVVEPPRALAQESEVTLPESGIRYPMGYDSNTVGEVRGSVQGLLLEPKKGPVRFELVTARETYIILACPGWLWSDLAPGIRDGDEVRVRGSKSQGVDGKLYLVAQEIERVSTGRVLTLRTEDGFPLWSGHRGGVAGRQGKGASHGGTGTTTGSGAGGRGRGGRR